MYHYHRLLIIVLTAIGPALLWMPPCRSALAAGPGPLLTDRVQTVLDRTIPRLQGELSGRGFRLGAPLFIRILKLPGQLEVWLQKKGRYQLFKSYPICRYSGFLGPKMHEGDWQSPEGFYRVTPEQMHPRSSYHLAFNIGYPNTYDRSLNRSGSNIMVHGDCSSMGCFAMQDYRMEEIYTLAHSALGGGQDSFAVHVFPFAMTRANMEKYEFSPWYDFWTNLQEGYAAFERTGQVPAVKVENGRYVVTQPGVKLARSGGN